VQVVSNGFEKSFSEWGHRGGGICEAATGFKSEKYPHRVYRLKWALYGLKQAPRAWYERLRGFLLSRGFVMGTVDRTLFLLKHGNDLLVVQIYVDDIVFGG
jgi:hypothetical protein